MFGSQWLMTIESAVCGINEISCFFAIVGGAEHGCSKGASWHQGYCLILAKDRHRFNCDKHTSCVMEVCIAVSCFIPLSLVYALQLMQKQYTLLGLCFCSSSALFLSWHISRVVYLMNDSLKHLMCTSSHLYILSKFQVDSRIVIGFNRDDGKLILTLYNWMACGSVIFNKCTLNHVSNAAKMVALFHFDLFMPAPQEQTSSHNFIYLKTTRRTDCILHMFYLDFTKFSNVHYVSSVHITTLQRMKLALFVT